MIDLLVSTAILPEHSFLRSIRPEVETGGISWGWVILAVAGAALAAWIVAFLLQRDRRRHGPAVRLLATRLGLAAEQRRLVERMAAVAGFGNAGCVLISRGCFDVAMRRFVAKHGQAGRLHVIRRLVFE